MADEWNDDELSASVKAYRDMQRLERDRKAYSKRAVYRKLADQYGRTDKAFEYRMQNISAVLDQMGEDWLPGLKPAGNVGANVQPKIEALLRRYPIAAPPAEAPAYRAMLPAMRDWLINVARARGKVTYGEVNDTFGLTRGPLLAAMDVLGHQSANLEEPIITALIVNKETQRCSPGLEAEFGVVDDEAERQRLYEHWSRTDNPIALEPDRDGDPIEVKAARFASVEVRPAQAAFRQRIFTAYEGRCVLTGCTLRQALDAAHRRGRSWRNGHNQATDGYLLRKDVHALYDAGLLHIDDDGTVRLEPVAAEHYPQLLAKRVE